MAGQIQAIQASGSQRHQGHLGCRSLRGAAGNAAAQDGYAREDHGQYRALPGVFHPARDDGTYKTVLLIVAHFLDTFVTAFFTFAHSFLTYCMVHLCAQVMLPLIAYGLSKIWKDHTERMDQDDNGLLANGSAVTNPMQRQSTRNLVVLVVGVDACGCLWLLVVA